MNLKKRLEYDQPWRAYLYRWGNNPKRATLKGRQCRVLARLARNSALVEFENGQREVISRNALKRQLPDPREGRAK
jgi:hypothetical protein